MRPDEPSLPKRKRRRLEGFDYSSGGAYFVTICVHSGEPIFGRIVAGAVQPSPAGLMAASVWWGLESRFLGLHLDEWIVMPDHVHGILLLDGGHASLDEIIGAYKSMTTRLYIDGVRKEGWRPFPGRLWQRSYHDRVICSEGMMRAIREYVATNPIRSTAAIP